MVRKFAGVFALLLGVLLGGWVFYNLFIHRMPEAQGRNPIPPIVMAVLFVVVGIKWIRGDAVS